MNKKIFKRNFLSIAAYCVFELGFLRAVSHIDNYDVGVMDVVNVAGAIIVFFLLLKSILFPYIILEAKTIKIYHDFMKDTVLIDEVVKCDVAEGYFELRSGKRINFNPSILRQKGIDTLKEFSAEVCE